MVGAFSALCTVAGPRPELLSKPEIATKRAFERFDFPAEIGRAYLAAFGGRPKLRRRTLSQTECPGQIYRDEETPVMPQRNGFLRHQRRG
jgi:hypothetical protein